MNPTFNSHKMITTIFEERCRELIKIGFAFDYPKSTKCRKLNDILYLIYIDLLSKMAFDQTYQANAMKLCDEFVEFYHRASCNLSATENDMRGIARIENVIVRDYLLEQLADYIKF